VVDTVCAGAATEIAPRPVTCPGGLAQGAVVFPLPHRATIRLVLAGRPGRRGELAVPASVPDLAALGRSWDAQLDRAAAVELPDPTLGAAWRAAQRTLLVAFDGVRVTAPVGRVHRWPVVTEARVVRALGRAGLRHEATTALTAAGDEADLGSWVRREDASVPRNVALLDALADHWRLTRSAEPAEDLLPVAAKAVRWLERGLTRTGADLAGYTYDEVARAVTGLADVARGLRSHEAAAELDAVAARLAELAPAPVDDPSGEVEAASDAPMAPTGPVIDPAAELAALAARVVAGDAAPQVVARLAEVLAVGDPTWSWPTRVHPRLGTGSGGSGEDPAVAAAVVELVRGLVVREAGTPDAPELALLPAVPRAWFGQNIDVRDLPTVAGRLSFSIRWHGARPALLWEVVTPRDVDTLVVSVPGLDPVWCSTSAKGDALLAAPPSPAGDASTTASPSGDAVAAGSPTLDEPGPSFA
jgi:hypothetical protein